MYECSPSRKAADHVQAAWQQHTCHDQTSRQIPGRSWTAEGRLFDMSWMLPIAILEGLLRRTHKLHRHLDI